MPVFWWMRLDLFFLVGNTVSSGVFWGAFDLIMILGNLSPNGCGCVPVLQLFGMGCPALELAGR